MHVSSDHLAEDYCSQSDMSRHCTNTKSLVELCRALDRKSKPAYSSDSICVVPFVNLAKIICLVLFYTINLYVKTQFCGVYLVFHYIGYN